MTTDLGRERWKAYFIVLVVMLASFGVSKQFPAWFKPKDVGIGIQPATWQGWLVAGASVSVVLWVLWRSRRDR
jgi:hypothetical protein